MELKEAMFGRRSIRAYKDKEVPRPVIEDLIKKTMRAPSALNLQPWEFVITIGEEKIRLSRKLLKAYHERKISCGPSIIKPLPPQMDRRMRESFDPMRSLLDEMGSSMSDFINEGSCDFYGAPVAIILCLDDAFSKTHLLSLGICVGYLLLAAYEQGLGACPIGLINAYADEIREQLNIPASKDVVLGIALGYPDWGAAINRFVSPREEISKAVRWID